MCVCVYVFLSPWVLLLINVRRTSYLPYLNDLCILSSVSHLTLYTGESNTTNLFNELPNADRLMTGNFKDFVFTVHAVYKQVY